MVSELSQNGYGKAPHEVLSVLFKPMFKRAISTHKGNNGHVLIIGGDSGYTGAIVLAGVAALRVGSGLVSLATRSAHAGIMSLYCPELMVHGVEQIEQLQCLLDKASVVVIGPGLGQSDWANNLLMLALATFKPLIIDADALNLLAQKTLSPAPHRHWILTPHPGEAARLLKCSTESVQQNRLASVRTLQALYGGVAVLKGPGTLIADGQAIAQSLTGNPGMATGGMGDVLTGVIAGLCAQGLDLTEAAQQGVYIHGAAADNAADAAGERGLLPTDLMPYLRQWVNK